MDNLMDERHADVIKNMIEEKFYALTRNSEFRNWKVLAGVVMTRGPDLHNAEVVVVSTGSKCNNDIDNTFKGKAIINSHAEVLARRGVIKYFYDQILLLKRNQASIFKTTINSRQLYELKDNVHFHLYISTAPCGDASVFCHSDNLQKGKDTHPNRPNRGQLRANLNNGDGSIPINPSSRKSKLENRLWPISCSDKIAKWNVLGIQGSLLSSIMEPIYLSSITLGDKFHRDHFQRAVFGRVKTLSKKEPQLISTSSAVVGKKMKRAPKYALNWVSGEGTMEVVKARTGIKYNGSTSRLSKLELWKKFKLTSGHYGAANVDYSHFKSDNSDKYQQAKSNLIRHFKNKNLGDWTSVSDITQVAQHFQIN